MVSKQKGFSLVEMLVVTAIIGVLAAAFARLMGNQLAAERGLTEKLATLDLGRLLINNLADGTVCTGVLSDSTVNPKAPYKVNTAFPATTKIKLNSLPATSSGGAPTIAQVGQQASSLSTKILVNSIDFKNFVPAGPNAYIAELDIGFTAGTIAMKPLTMKMVIATDNKGVIQNCGSSTSNAVQVLQSLTLNTNGKQSTGNSPWNQSNVMCTKAFFQAGLNPAKIRVTGSVSYGSTVMMNNAQNHRYTFFGVNLNALVGTVDVCLDAGGDYTFNGEIFTWWILYNP